MVQELVGLRAVVASTEPVNSLEGRPAGLELLRVRVPLLRNHRSANSRQSERESILVRWLDVDGSEGWSECPTLSDFGYVTESTDAAWAALVNELGPAVLAGRSPSPIGAPAAAASLADAKLDCELRAGGMSLGEWLQDRVGSRSRSAVPWCAVLADVTMSVDDALLEVRAAAASGCGMLKLKVDGRRPDPQVLGAVMSAWDGPLALDANGTLDHRSAVELDSLGLAYIEQPLAPGTPWESMAALRRDLRTPVALDESLVSGDAVLAALRAGAVGVVSVKPSRVGGLASAAAIFALAAQFRIDCFVGGMFELGIGRAAGLAVASLEQCRWPCDLGPSSRYVELDVCEPLVTDEHGHVIVPHGPGLGRIPTTEGLSGRVSSRVTLAGP